jgi:23S rRNA (cytidine1920-2'-O)/16S rRNA (cytidine1409-2'-O)-methyltransferase
VRADASVRLVAPRRLRGHTKLSAALDVFELDVTGAVAVDVGAAAGGFTTALLERSAARVYAVDVGHGQLAPALRADARVVNLERTNVADLHDALVAEPVDVVTLDLSYLAVAVAAPALHRLRLAPDATLLALVKPTFELRAATLVTAGAAVRSAVEHAVQGVERAGWRALACTIPAVTGAGGAVEVFLLARRSGYDAAATNRSRFSIV